jgi:hypothetical protein
MKINIKTMKIYENLRNATIYASGSGGTPCGVGMGCPPPAPPVENWGGGIRLLQRSKNVKKNELVQMLNSQILCFCIGSTSDKVTNHMQIPTCLMIFHVGPQVAYRFRKETNAFNQESSLQSSSRRQSLCRSAVTRISC